MKKTKYYDVIDTREQGRATSEGTQVQRPSLIQYQGSVIHYDKVSSQLKTMLTMFLNFLLSRNT